MGWKARGGRGRARRHRPARRHGDLAAQRDGVAAHRRAPGAAGFRDVAGEDHVAHAVGRFGQLAQEAARRLEGAVHVPQRAGAAEAGELQPRGGVALGDRAGLIDADEEEGHALGARALQGREPVATCSIEAPNWIEPAVRGRGGCRARPRRSGYRASGRAGEVVGHADAWRWRARYRSGTGRGRAWPPAAGPASEARIGAEAGSAASRARRGARGSACASPGRNGARRPPGRFSA
jgi:hypothetical protein